MSSFLIYATFINHPKVVGLKLEAIGLWTLCGSYCAAFPQLDGRVPRHVVVGFAKAEAKALATAAELVARGLWVEDGDGWRFHDWHDYQPIPFRSSRPRCGAGLQ